MLFVVSLFTNVLLLLCTFFTFLLLCFKVYPCSSCVVINKWIKRINTLYGLIITTVIIIISSSNNSSGILTTYLFERYFQIYLLPCLYETCKQSSLPVDDMITAVFKKLYPLYFDVLLPLDVDVPSPDEKSVITYVSSIYDAFPKIPEGGEGITPQVCAVIFHT